LRADFNDIEKYDWLLVMITASTAEAQGGAGQAPRR
jgi:hypothetical protein